MAELSGTPGHVNPPTLKDVARLAGVSVATASKALNGRVHVHQQTRQRVIETAQRISFSPNRAAQSLSTRQTGTVGLITSDLDGRFSIPILLGAEDAFGAGKVSVLLCDARGDTLREQYQLQTLLDRRVDGIIVVGSNSNPRPSLGKGIPVPVVYAYAPSNDPSDISLVPDDEQAGEAAAAYLLTSGRTAIAHIGGNIDYKASTDRARGVRRALTNAGLEFASGEPMFGEWSEQWGRTAASQLVHSNVHFDSVLCGNDQIARGVLDALREEHRSVPQEVSVMGFDNWSLFVEGSRPALTSVDLNLENLGREAAYRLFEAIDGLAQPGLTRHACRVVPRHSA